VINNTVIMAWKGSDCAPLAAAGHEPVTVWYRILSRGFPSR
jgi:hypothetical protein